jgi:hypothetical protein
VGQIRTWIARPVANIGFEVKTHTLLVFRFHKAPIGRDDMIRVEVIVIEETAAGILPHREPVA